MQISNERGYWRGWCPAWHTWLFGNLVYLDGVPYIVADKKVDEDSRVVEVRRPPSSSNPGNLFTEEVGSLYVEAQQVSVESVGEFTGFYDKQGWPIFEDDYLESPGSDRAYHYIATYDHESHYIYGTPTADSFFSRNLDELSEEAVVCGNDYEHEFLGKKYPWEGEEVTEPSGVATTSRLRNGCTGAW